MKNIVIFSWGEFVATLAVTSAIAFYNGMRFQKDLDKEKKGN